MIQILLNYIPKSPIENKSTLVQGMAWCLAVNKPILEPMMT